MDNLNTTEHGSNDELKKQDTENSELSPQELEQLSGGTFHEGAQQNHNQTCTVIG